jgi:hypothetical protein
LEGWRWRQGPPECHRSVHHGGGGGGQHGAPGGASGSESVSGSGSGECPPSVHAVPPHSPPPKSLGQSWFLLINCNNQDYPLVMTL